MSASLEQAGSKPPAGLPLVSFLIPAYNHERFIEKCLDSVLFDKYPSKQLVVINDGSTDRTAQLIADWIARHKSSLDIRYVDRENKGVAATLNELRALATGTYLRLGASDDYYLPEGTSPLVSYLETNPKKLAVVGDSIVVDEDERVVHDSAMVGLFNVDKSRYGTDEGIRREIISRWAIGGPVPLLRAQGLDVAEGWNEDFLIDDWDFFLRLAALGAIGFIDVKVGAYRLHGTNTSKTSDRAKRIANLRNMADAVNRNVIKFNEQYRILLRAQGRLIAAKIAYLEGRYIDAAWNVLVFGGLRAASSNALSRLGAN
ncbi:glycosyltransferase family 2 protein [Bradyrhizobium sp. 180]|uniref:glycosyltransferase family 2 protein n=1 Tax=unclassified Bradyrhizobium TaxID=2631580 RepID=UPI001FF9089C|nr:MULTISPECIES: glycosyltransferase family 2 protein [unclassified Bradyrhizobium]MCK1493775.1 glycosyltransferase family 2 protein [Bradyrhizobium sp. 180]MCK1667757.1 glycosyltransferase family 2 protein [Bradyrhizobium sp. 153]